MTIHSINEQISDLEKNLKENLSQNDNKSDEYFRQLFDVLPDAVLIHQGGRIIFANSAAAVLYGADNAKTLLGMLTLDFVHPDDKETLRKRQHGMLAGDAGAPLLAQRRVRLDGAVVEVEVSVRPIDCEGKRSIVVVSRDISERVKTEKALRESKERLQNISANLPGMMYQRVLLPDGTVEFPYMSDGIMDILGIDAQSAMENPSQLIEIIHPDDASASRPVTNGS